LFSGARGSTLLTLVHAKTRTQRAASHLRSLTCSAAIAFGLALASLVALSFRQPISLLSFFNDTRQPEPVVWRFELQRGASVNLRHHPFVSGRIEFSQIGPLTFRWNADRHLVFPIWPLPVPLLSWGGFVFIRRERSLFALRKGHCLKCGYDLAATPGPICPECGKRRS
jgi:hypothetical protein